jgi:hypothetical protein
MKMFSLLTLLLLLSAFMCVGAGTALGASNDLNSSTLNSSSLQANLTNQNNQSLDTSRAGTTISASNGNINSADVQVSVTNQNPDTARPGEPVELTLSVQDIGNSNLKDITVTLNPEYPFSKLPGEDLQKSISYLNARQDDNDAGVLKFKLMTDANASEGTYDLDIVTAYKSGSGSSATTYTTKQTVQLEIQGKEYAQVVTVSKADIDIAKEEPLEFIVTNTGSSPLKNLVFSWTDPKGVVLPVYSDNTKYIKYLDAGQSVKVDYTVMADVSADPGLYTLNVNLSYEDSDSSAKSIKTTAGLFVGGATDFDVSFSESSAGETSLSVANVGNNIAYAVKVSIPDQDGYKVSGSSSTIVGNLEKGDYTIASFNVTNTRAAGNVNSGTAPDTANKRYAAGDNASSSSMNSNPLKVQIEYTDAKGERITVDKDVAIQMSSFTGFGTGGRSGARGNRSSGLSSSLPYILGIVVIGAGVFLYRRRKQGAKKAEDKNSQLNPTQER